MPTSQWVFVRGPESLRVRRSTTRRELSIQGPGNLQRIGSFSTDGELRTFETELFTRLLDEGWILERSLGS